MHASNVSTQKNPLQAGMKTVAATLMAGLMLTATAGNGERVTPRHLNQEIRSTTRPAHRPTREQIEMIRVEETVPVNQKGFPYLIPEPVAEAKNNIAVEDLRVQALASQYKRTHEIEWMLPKDVAQWWPMIQNAGSIYDVDPVLISAVMMQESGGQKSEIGKSGDTGLMQVVLKYHKLPKYEDPLDPQTNIYEGTSILSYELKKTFRGNTEFAVASYNIGEGKIKRTGRLTPLGNLYINYILKRLTYINMHANLETAATADPIAAYMQWHSAELISEIESGMASTGGQQRPNALGGVGRRISTHR